MLHRRRGTPRAAHARASCAATAAAVATSARETRPRQERLHVEQRLSGHIVEPRNKDSGSMI